MKKLLLSACVAFALLASTNTFAQQGFGTNTPDKSAAVDIVSSQRGMLIPRVSLVATNNQAPVVATPAQSLLVYNTATSVVGANAVTPGFYYWDTDKWVRIVSTTSEKITKVVGGNNVIVDDTVSPDGLTTTYTVNVAGGDTPGQVLVTILNPSYNPADPNSEQYISEWVNPADFISGVNGITITPNPTTGVNEIGIGGALTDTTGTEIVTDPTTGKTLAIQGLEVLTPTTFDPAIQNIMVMGADGILKQVAPKTLIEDAIDAGNLTAKSLKTSGIITLNGVTTDATNTVLKDVTLDIRNGSIGPEKLDPAGATPGQIATVVNNAGTNVIQYVNPSTGIGQTLTTDNIIGVGADAGSATASSLNGAVLTPTYLKIKDNAITATQIAEDAVGASELANNAVASENIINGTIKAEDIQAPGSTTNTGGTANQVMVTDNAGNVSWVNQSTVANKDNYIFAAPLAKDAGTNNSTGGKDYNVTIATASATTLGVVKQAATDPEVAIAADGTLSINEANVILGGDVTGPLNNTKVTGIQGVDVSTTLPTATNNMLVYNSTTNTWEPSTVAAAAGEDLTTDGKIVIGDNTSSITTKTDAVLVATQLSIKQGSIGNVELAPGAVSSDKMTSYTTANGTATPVAGGMVPTANGSGGVTYQTVADAAGKTLTGAGITVTAGTTAGTGTSLAKSVLADVTLGIANDAITTDKIAADAVTAAKINVDVAGAGLKQNATTGALEVDLSSTGIGKGLTTDSVIEITGTGATAINSATESVLKDITLSIGTDKITATHIAPDAVGASELADNAVASANIIDGAVSNVDLAPASVSADKMTSYTTANGTATPVATGMVPTANGAGGVTYQTPNSLINVNNGLTRNTAASDVIQLGGNLIKSTAINTAVGDAGFTLAVTGLENVAPTTATKNKAIVAQTADGVLRTVDKVVTGTNANVAANAGYSFHTPEVVINVTLANADQTVVFPSAADAEGQVINIRIVNEDETHTGYLNILDTYGSMPFQAWIVKSNGSNWEIVGRN